MSFGDFLKGPVGGLLTGGLGSIASGIFSANEAQRSRDFQENMYKNAVQMRVRDLIAAGVNPMLAAGMGLGGGLPSGAMAHAPDFAGSMARGSQASSAAKIAQKQADLMESERDVNSAQAEKLRSEIPVNVQLVDYYVAAATEKYASAGQAEAHRRVLQETLPKLAAEVKNIQASTNELDRRAALHRAEESLKGLTEDQMRALLPFMVDTAKSESIIAQYGILPARNWSEAAKSDFNKLAAHFKGLTGSQILAIALKAFFTDAINEER